MSFKGPRELVELYPSLIPHDPTFDSYRAAFTENDLLHAAWNSLKVATATALITTLIGLPAAYVLARSARRDLEARARLDPAQPDVPADPDHHPALPAAPGHRT